MMEVVIIVICLALLDFGLDAYVSKLFDFMLDAGNW